MLVISVITLLPQVFHPYLNAGILRRAKDKGLVRFEVLNLRHFATDRHRSVDDYPYGGGPGMVLMPEPLARAVEYAKADGLRTRTILMSPQGKVFSQEMAQHLAEQQGRLLLIAGRYEGVDERVVQSLVDMQLSIGDYILSGGELPALVIIDAVVRLLPGALGGEASAQEESFAGGILEHPHYTRPPVWRGMKVPEVLLGGNHQEIARFRRKEALRRTLRLRPDLLKKAALSDLDRQLLEEMKEEEGDGPHKER
jgi:tRNA (guanine37-N1)-methyltransferase